MNHHPFGSELRPSPTLAPKGTNTRSAANGERAHQRAEGAKAHSGPNANLQVLMSRFCPFSPLFMIKVWFSISQKPLFCLPFYSGSAPNWDPLFAGSHLGLDPYLNALVSFGAERVMEPIRSRCGIGSRPLRLGVVPVRCQTGGRSYSGPNELRPPSP